MSKLIRDMIDKVKNYRPSINENVFDNKIIFVRTKNFNNTGTINKLPYDGIQCWAIYKNDLDKYINELEFWGGNRKDIEIINPTGYNIFAINYPKAHKYVMGETNEVPELIPYNKTEHTMQYIKQGNKSMLEYISELGLNKMCYQILLTKGEQLNENDLKHNGPYYKHLKPYQQRREDFINSIKTFADFDDNKIRECIYYMGSEGFNDEEDAFEFLKERIKFYKQMPDPVILYRVIGVKNKKMIRTKELGQHYTPHKWNINGDTLLLIGYENWDDETKPYVIEVLAPHSEIDIIQTIIQNLAFPSELEINLKNNGKGAKFIKAYKLKGF